MLFSKYRFVLPIFSTLILLIIALFLCFYALGSSPLALWDEVVNARVVSELVDTGSFPALTYLGTPFLEKPPLWYFLTAQVVRIAGLSETTLRVVSAVSGFLLILLVLAAARQWYGIIAGFVSAATLAAAGHLFVPNAGGFFSTHTARSADPDMLFIFLTTLSFVCLSGYGGKSGKWLYWGSAISALAVLTKGFLGTLPLLVFAPYAFIAYRRPRIPSVYIRNVFLIFCIVALPWYIVMLMSNGYNFIYYHFGYHVLLRALTPLEGHGAPWWFYLRIIAARDVFPFIEILFIGLIIAIRDKHFFRRIRIFGPVILFILFLFIPLMAQTKLSWYILPVYPFAALLTGRFSRRLWDYMRSEKTSSFIRIASILVLMYMMIVLVISIRANIRSIIIHSPPQNPAVAYNR